MRVFDNESFFFHPDFQEINIGFGEKSLKPLIKTFSGDLRHLELALHKIVTRQVEAEMLVRYRRRDFEEPGI